VLLLYSFYARYKRKTRPVICWAVYGGRFVVLSLPGALRGRTTSKYFRISRVPVFACCFAASRCCRAYGLATCSHCSISRVGCAIRSSAVIGYNRCAAASGSRSRTAYNPRTFDRSFCRFLLSLSASVLPLLSSLRLSHSCNTCCQMMVIISAVHWIPPSGMVE